MNALSRDLRAAAAAITKTEPVAPRKGFWVRVFDAIVESRMRKSQDDLRMHRQAIADLRARIDLEAAGKAARDLPRHLRGAGKMVGF